MVDSARNTARHRRLEEHMTFVHRLRLAPFVAFVALLVSGAGGADAATVNVATTGVNGPACGDVGSPCATLAYVVANRLTTDPDTIQLGAGQFTMPGLVVSQAMASGDTIAGSGSGALPAGTSLEHANAGDNSVLQIDVPLTVRSLSVKVPLGTALARKALGIGAAAAGTHVEDVAVSVENASTAPSIVTEASATGVVFDRLRVTGNHVNDALDLGHGTGAVVQDSVLRGGTAAPANALHMDGGDALVRRTRLSRDFAAAGLDPVVEAISSQLTVESSLVTGGRVGINSQAVPPATSTLTLRGVTIDVANPGTADAPPDRHPIYVRTTMPGAASSTARVERSIFLEQVYTFAEAGSTTKVDCVDSILPLQESATVACGGATGNLAATALDTFVNSAAGDYHLRPGSPAVDGASAALADGESPTDLDGNPRLLDGDRDCLARADRGAYELTGQAADPASCTGPGPGPGPIADPPPNAAPVLDRASFAKAAFPARGKKRGTRLRFRLSEDAAVTVTVEALLAGRRRGKTCVAPTKRNKRAKACTRAKKRGTLALKGKKGDNAIAFSGRLGKTTLAPGAYRARLTARDAGPKKSAERTLRFRVLAK